jgi:hypothetical protein
MAFEKGVAQTVDVPTWKDGILTAPSGAVTATIIKDGADAGALNGSVAKVTGKPAVHLALSATDTNCACGLVLITDSGGGMDDLQFSFATESIYTEELAEELIGLGGAHAVPITLTVVDQNGDPVRAYPVSIMAATRETG